MRDGSHLLLWMLLTGTRAIAGGPCEGERQVYERLEAQLSKHQDGQLSVDTQQAREAWLACRRRDEDEQDARVLQRISEQRAAARAKQAEEQQRKTDEFIAQERARQEEIEQRKLRAQAEHQRVASEPGNRSVVFGAQLCVIREGRTATRAAIAEEKKYARVGGVIDLKKMYDLQTGLRIADEDERSVRQAMRSSGVAARPCTDGRVKALLACRAAGTCAGDDQILSALIEQYH